MILYIRFMSTGNSQKRYSTAFTILYIQRSLVVDVAYSVFPILTLADGDYRASTLACRKV
jgi:hypothetical protein